MLKHVAKKLNLDGLAITNHDYYDPCDSDTIVTIPGIEISTSRGHVLVIGPDPPEVTNPGEMDPATVIPLARDRGCATIIAHPFRNSSVRGVDAPFDAVEINGKHQFDRELVEQISAERDIPLVGGSDAHYPVEVGRAYTEISVDELTPESVVAAIKNGAVEAKRLHSQIHSPIRRMYRASHRLKGQINESINPRSYP